MSIARLPVVSMWGIEQLWAAYNGLSRLSEADPTVMIQSQIRQHSKLGSAIHMKATIIGNAWGVVLARSLKSMHSKKETGPRLI